MAESNSNKIIAEYEGYDFGFSAVSEDTPTTQQVATTSVSSDDFHDELHDALLPIHDALETITNKVENLENILQSGITDNFDIEGYKTLVEKDVTDKLKAVEALVMPLLVNLMKNPEKDTIKWPNRKPIIEKQIEKILAITRDGA